MPSIIGHITIRVGAKKKVETIPRGGEGRDKINYAENLGWWNVTFKWLALQVEPFLHQPMNILIFNNLLEPRERMHA